MPRRETDHQEQVPPDVMVNGEAASSLIDRLMLRLSSPRGALLPLLHAVQHEVGYVPDALVPAIALRLNLSRADVHGVVTFYHDFRRKPAGASVVKICRAEACKARGSDRIEALLSERLATAPGTTRADGLITLEPVYCLGLCAVGPNALVDGVPLAGLDEARVDAIAERLSHGA